MNKLPLKLLATFLLCSLANIALAEHSLTQLWKTGSLPTPESVLYVKQKKDEFLLVSLIDGSPTEADQEGGVAKLSLDGAILEKYWIDGLNAPKGMGIYKGKIYVADINEVVVISLKQQKVIKKIPVPGSVFLNDVSVNNKGVVFVSDTRLNNIYRIEGDKVELYMTDISGANGLKVFGKNLIVGTAKQLLLIDAKKQKLPLAEGFAQGIDGVEMTERGEFLVSCWGGLIYYVDVKGKVQLLLDSVADKINTADIGYDRARRHLFVPNFLKNSVTAYQLNEK